MTKPASMRKNHVVHFRLTEDEYRRLREIAWEGGVTVSLILRQGVKEILMVAD